MNEVTVAQQFVC